MQVSDFLEGDQSKNEIPGKDITYCIATGGAGIRRRPVSHHDCRQRRCGVPRRYPSSRFARKKGRPMWCCKRAVSREE